MGVFVQRLEQRTEATRPEENMISAIGAQCVWRDTLCSMYGPTLNNQRPYLEQVKLASGGS